MEEPHLSLELEEDLLQEAPIILVGKIISDKPLQKRRVINFLNTTWKPIIKEFSISYWGKIDTYAFQFKFAEDADKILGMAPWFILGNLLLLQRWELCKSFDELNFNLCPFWIQIHGLPRSYFTENNAKTIGGSLGTFVSVEGLGVNSRVLSYLRLRIVLDISKPFRKCFSVKGKDGNIIRWASIRYEKLGSICFRCEKLGHVMIDCGETEPSKSHLDVDMRTGSTRRVLEAEEKKLRMEVSQECLQDDPLSSRNTDISQPEKINIQERSLETRPAEHLIPLDMESAKRLNILAAHSLMRNTYLQIGKDVVKQYFDGNKLDEDDDDDNDESEDEDEDEDEDEEEEEDEDEDDDDDDDEEDEDEDDKDEEEVVYISSRSKQILIEKETPDVVFKPSATSAHDDDAVDETGLVDRDIRIVMEQADASRSRAAKALKAADGDLVEAIMKLIN